MFRDRSFSSPASPRRPAHHQPQLLVSFLLLGLGIALVSTPAFAQVEETLAGAPDLTPLSPHVTFPDLGTIPWPIDCSAWPEDPPDDGYLASIFGHRIQSGTDFHRGIDLRCDLEGDTCCQPIGGGPIQCGERTCSASEEEVPGAPIHAIVGGTVHKAKDGGNNNLVIKTERSADDISIGATDCDKMYVWYQHMRSTYAINPATGQEWAVGDTVTQGQHLGYQGREGADSVHLHMSTRVCTNSRADGDPPGTLDPEINPFQLIGSDDGQAPQILSLTTNFDGADLLVTVQIETDDPDFDQLEIAVYDAPNDQRTVRRLGYNSRYGIDIAGDDMDTSLLEPNDLSELTTIAEPAPPSPTSGFTLTARFTGLALASDPDSRVQVKAADVFGNTATSELQIFGDAAVGDAVWSDDDGNGLQDAGEAGLAGVGVELYTAAGALVDQTVTDAFGGYGFSELVAGDYFLRFSPASGYGATLQVPGFPELDSDVDPQTGESAVFTLASGDTDLSIDAGFTSACFDVALVSWASAWRHSGTYTAGWSSPSFDDSVWSEGLGDLGYNTSRVYTTIPENGLTSYFRLAFEVDDVSLFDNFDLSLYRDDGAIVYLNGVEVMRSNLPAGAVDENTAASSYSEATETVNLPASHLLTGTNVLAVEVHNRELNDNDFSFDLELAASVCRACVHAATFTADAGTWLDSSDPGDAGGSDTELRIDGDPERSVLLSWDLASLPASAGVLHAELVVEVTDDSSSEHRIFALSRAWDEATADWNYATGGASPVAWETAGANGASDRDSTPLALTSFDDGEPSTSTVVFNPSGRALVEDWIDGTIANHGLMIHGDAGENYQQKIQSEETAGAPLLNVVYASACGN